MKQDALRRNEKNGWQLEQLSFSIAMYVPEAAVPASTANNSRDRDSSKSAQPQKNPPKIEEKKEDEEKRDSLVMTGLYLDGATWLNKEHRLSDAPKTSTFETFPKIIVTILREAPHAEAPAKAHSEAPAKAHSARAPFERQNTMRMPDKVKNAALLPKDVEGTTYLCPLYSSPKRTQSNHILDVPIATENAQMVVSIAPECFQKI